MKPINAPGPTRNRHVVYARLLGLLFCAAGFAAIGIGWAGMASRACVDCQLPYLLSGGAAGVALVILGVALLLIAELRAEGRGLAERIDHLAESNSRMAFEGAAQERVVAGRSSYHRPDCRLLRGKQGLESVPVQAAALRGLTPCRICVPPEANGEPARREVATGSEAE